MQEQDMKSLLEAEEESMQEVREHDVVKATVVAVDDGQAYVNIAGLKADIPISKRELASPEPDSAKDVVQVDDVIEVFVVSLGGEDAVNGTGTWEDDGSGRKSLDLVGVVGRVDAEVLTADALEVEVADGVLDRGVGLQAHLLAQTVEVEPCDAAVFVTLAGLALDDGGKGGHFEGAQSQASRLARTLPLPEALVMCVDAVEEFAPRSRPA